MKNDELITAYDTADAFIPEAYFFFEGLDLKVVFGDDRVATMSLERQEEKEVVERFLADPNMWATFFGSLSVALKDNM